MAAGTYNIFAEQGADLLLQFTYRDPDGEAIDLTGYSARMQVRKTRLNSAVLLDATDFLGFGESTGVITLAIPAEALSGIPAGEYRYDIELESAGGVVTRVLQGDFSVDGEVTR